MFVLLETTNSPVTRVVNGRGDAVGVVSGETEAVVLLEVLIGSHTEREGEKGREDSQGKSHL